MKEMNVQEFLVAAKNNINDPSKWTKNKMAANNKGEAVYIEHPNAVCFCMYGALMKVDIDRKLVKDHYYDVSEEYKLALNSLLELTALTDKGPYLEDFNDDPGTTHEMVMKLFDDAISSLGN